MDKTAKPVNYEMIPEFHGDDQTAPYKLLAEIRERFHEEIEDAKIALAWRVRLKPDVDGHLVLGRCVKVSDLQREFADFDFIIVLNREVWNSIEFSRDKQAALLDHELCHASIAMDDDTGEVKIDERGRQIFRLRKHDIEEFEAVVTRHGTYKRDLQKFAEALLKKRQSPLFTEENENTVSIRTTLENGEVISTEPIPVSKFHDMAESIGKSLGKR